MKKLQILVFSLLLVGQSFAQPDLQKLQQEYISRKPLLDSMHAYPDVPFDSLKVTNKEGISISFWWMPQGENKGTVLLVHGFMMNKSNMLSRAKIYYDLGYNVIVMDLRARGQSGGTAATSGPEIRSDVIAVMDYYGSHLKQFGKLILAGYSHGGRSVVFAAEKKPGDVQAIILESIPYSLSASFRRTYKMEPPPIPEGNMPEAFHAISGVPVLLMTGDSDEVIVPEEAGEIRNSNKNTLSQFMMFKATGHNLFVEKNRKLYSETIKSFLAALH
jgi:pimeloyl-ACP methyl ester carboxylesterase